MIPIYEDGIHIEVSILPEQAASSLFTAIPVSPEIERSSSMNALVKAALSKLIGDDEVFRSELETMIDGVNRAASAPDAIVREVQSATPVPADTVTREEPPPNAPDVAVEPDAGTNAPPKSQFTSDQLNEIANSLIGNQQFLAALVSAVQAQDAAGAVEEVPPPPPAAVAQSMQIPPEVEEIMRAQKQAIDTLSAQVSQLAENAIVNLAEQPRRTERARDAIAVELSAPVGKNGKLDLGVKAASVLTKMGPPKTNK